MAAGDNDWTVSGYNIGSLASSGIDSVAILPKAELLALSRGKGNAENGASTVYGSVVKITSAGSSYTVYYQGLPFYTEDDHAATTVLGYGAGANYGNGRNFKVKTAWSDSWSEGDNVRVELNGNHGTCVGESASALSGWGKHTCSKRSQGVGGIWFNGGNFPGQNVNGATWIR
jgi:hypothetical protein